MTVKDPAVLEPKSPAARPARREAVGAEIPVTVHASRTTQGLGKNLPSVHEDTKTVIVLQQGAVVRLTAGLTTGETVVLTNRMTGADVLCRVGNIKSQAGIQHYVDLEFMQRAPGFWGDAVAAASAPIASEAPAAAPIAPAPTVLTPVAVLPPPAPVPAPPPPVPVAVVPPPPTPAPVAAAPVAVASPPPPPAPDPVVELPPAAAAETLQPAPLADPIAPSWKASPLSPVTPIRGGPNESSFGSISTQSAGGNTSGSQKALVAVAAAVLLALGGAASGYWFYSRQTQAAAASSPALQQTTQAANVPVDRVTPDLTPASSPVIESAPVTLSTEQPQPQMDVVLESRPAVDAPATRLQPPPVSAARTPAPAVRRSNVTVEQLKVPKARTTAARIDSSEPPPVMMGAASLGDTAGSLLVAESTGPAPPPAIGGQLQLPQLLTSTAAVYPPNARMSHLEGTVTLDALVDETGKVVETKVIAGPAPFLQAAQESVRNWRYKPAQLNGKPIAVHTKVSVRFSLR